MSYSGPNEGFVPVRWPAVNIVTPTKPGFKLQLRYLYIESVWAIIKKRMTPKKRTRTELENEVQKLWDDVRKEGIVRKLSDSMQSRCQAVVDSNGYPTKY